VAGRLGAEHVREHRQPFVSRIAGTGVGSSGSSSVLTGPAHAGIPSAGEALGNEPPHARFARCGQQRVSALRPKPVRLRETTVEVLEVPQIRKSGRLMDDGSTSWPTLHASVSST
jgi:hypothetical protein